jgi:hyperosmotically inducible periplasmic protein
MSFKMSMILKIFLSVILSLALFGTALAAEKLTSDDAIYDYVRRKLASDQVVKGGGLQVDVHQGVVTLRGTVEEQRQKERAAKLAKKIAGVKSVDNQLTVVQRGDKK